ncbi:MAG: response regulator transcription factor [Spirochaetes bacterium]|nr:response regulator transcription factor [Spirochaetota bacterium]
MNNQIFILGKTNLYNDLLSYALKEKIGYKCIVVEDVNDIFTDEKFDSNTLMLILIDSKVISFEDVLKVLTVKATSAFNSYLIALFNLRSDSGIESKALSRKIKGFFYNKDSLEIFIRGIKSLFKGEVWVSRNILLKCTLDGFKQKTSIIMEKTELTQREIEILSLVSLGASNEDIANKMYISIHTVKTHLYNIYKKINVTNRLLAAIWAAKNL